VQAHKINVIVSAPSWAQCAEAHIPGLTQLPSTAGVGAYRTEELKPYVLNVVRKVRLVGGLLPLQCHGNVWAASALSLAALWPPHAAVFLAC
jgi:hypothetical protein